MAAKWNVNIQAKTYHLCQYTTPNLGINGHSTLFQIVKLSFSLAIRVSREKA